MKVFDYIIKPYKDQEIQLNVHINFTIFKQFQIKVVFIIIIIIIKVIFIIGI